ncbi:Ryanodine receptor 2 [Camelus dromedarius]|uniref:Ryanodine receptor 2 n=1 Tax=Camelus dromedarius TaxID=9838 RepID=A0A5N4CW90_CAMDR|nr:Ryanodine receptor 2 [Camelus dromedarius]
MVMGAQTILPPLVEGQHVEGETSRWRRMLTHSPGKGDPFITARLWQGQGELDVLRGQQLTLCILKAGHALLSLQDQLRRLLSQPAVQEAAAAHTGDFLGSFIDLKHSLAALIRGNRKNCAQFSGSLDWLISQLERLEASSELPAHSAELCLCLVLIHTIISDHQPCLPNTTSPITVSYDKCIERVFLNLYSVLVESPEVLNIIKEGHIKSIISLLDKHGRNHKHLICDNLLPGRDLLLQTRLVNHVSSMRPNIFLGVSEGSAQYKKWYYELMVNHTKPFVTAEATHLCMGWASTEGCSPYPGGGEEWGGNGVGDDLFSCGFDGLHLWSGCIARTVSSPNQHLLRTEDVISCCLDLSAPSISFRINGQPVQGMLENFNIDRLFFPVVSFSAGIKVRFLLGGRHGEFKFLPPPGYALCYEAFLPKEKLKAEHSREYKQERTYTRDLLGSTVSLTQAAFTPIPVDTSQYPDQPGWQQLH